MRLGRLKQRADFLRLRRARLRTASKGLVLQAERMPHFHATEHAMGGDDMRVGFTATKKIGNAVQRNRAKRRLRELARTLLSECGTPGYDYVMIARDGTVARTFGDLQDDLTHSLKRLGLLREGHGRGQRT